MAEQEISPVIDLSLEATKLERAKSLCNHGCWTVALQVRRLRSEEPEDVKFIFRFWADLQFLIVALRRLRRAATIAAFEPTVAAAIADFDRSLPGLATMRNVGEHVDAYATDDPKRHHLMVTRGKLQVGSFDGTTFDWLDQNLNIDVAKTAAERLFCAVRDAVGCLPKPSP
jgi:hypothetical protein